MTAAAARPAFAPDPHRRALLAKVHLAKKDLGLSDDDYQSVVLTVTGQMSAGTCDTAQLIRLVEHFKSKGFRASPGKAKPGARRPADHPSARKARAMWISLHQLGAIDNPSEQALEGFARRQLKVEALQWANQAQCYKLVEALKAIAQRHGWNQRVDHVQQDRAHQVLKNRLVDAILARMKAAGHVPAEWTVRDAAFRLCGIEVGPFPAGEELELLARHLGEKLRAMGGVPA